MKLRTRIIQKLIETHPRFRTRAVRVYGDIYTVHINLSEVDYFCSVEDVHFIPRWLNHTLRSSIPQCTCKFHIRGLHTGKWVWHLRGGRAAPTHHQYSMMLQGELPPLIKLCIPNAWFTYTVFMPYAILYDDAKKILVIWLMSDHYPFIWHLDAGWCIDLRFTVGLHMGHNMMVWVEKR